MALKPAEIYAATAAARLKVPPSSAQVEYYQQLAQMVLDILKDADVLGTGLVAPGGGGPVTGLAKIT
jgi:hypothetical protein